VGVFFKAIGALLSGKLWRATKGIHEKPDVVRARYQEVIQAKAQRIVTVQEAVAGLKRTMQREATNLTQLRKEIRETEEAVAGADAFIQQRASLLKNKGLSREQALEDAEIREHLSSKADFESSLAQMKAREADKTTYVTTTDAQVKDYIIELRGLQRDLEETRANMERDVADVAIAAEKRQVERALAGLNDDTTEADLRQIRESVDQVKAEAEVATEVSGTKVSIQREKYKSAARARMASSTSLDKVFGHTEGDKIAVAAVREEKSAELPLK
jgi:SMC interacting uncharacterized protein involved in chromosome segregation